MPIYEYAASAPCANPKPCSGTIEVFAKMTDADLTHCPQCGVAITRVISASNNSIGSAHLMQEKNFAAKGFTQYKKAGGGVYEKTAGDGPQFISGNN